MGGPTSIPPTEARTGCSKPYVDQYGKPKFTFLTSDDQALGKVRAGYSPDIVHPCVDYTPGTGSRWASWSRGTSLILLRRPRAALARAGR